MPRSARAGRISAALALTVLLAGCQVFGLGDDPEDDLLDQERRWKALGIHDYSYEFARQCFCGSHVGKVLIVVAGDTVNSVLDPTTLQPLDRSALGYTPGTIDDVFDQVRDVIANDPDDIELRFDSRFHFPVTVEVDYLKNAIDDELTLLLSNFLKYERLE